MSRRNPNKVRGYDVRAEPHGDDYVVIKKEWINSSSPSTMTINRESALDLLEQLIKMFPLEAMARV